MRIPNLSKSLNELYSKIFDFQKQLNETNLKIDELQKDLDKVQSLKKKGEETRNLFHSVGGENLHLITSDKVKLNATFLDTSAFKQELKNNNGQFVVLTKNTPNGETVKIEGISFKLTDIQQNENHIVNNLEKLNSLTCFELEKIKLGSGWTKVLDGENLILVRNENLYSIINNKTSDKDFISSIPGTVDFKLINPPACQLQREYREIDSNSIGGTVIIGSGIDGVYEQHKVEAMAFLFKGMNVMMVNFRGYGQNEGIPSEEGFCKDFEAAYEYCKYRTGHPDNKILIKGICMSGGPAAHLAAKYPAINIFLDQTFSNFQNLVESQVKDYLDFKVSFLKENKKINDPQLRILNICSSIIAKIASLLAPKFEVSKNLAKNNGRKAILFVYDDEVIPKNHQVKNIEAVAKSGKLGSLSVFATPGSHGTYWPHILSQKYEFQDIGKHVRAIRKETVEKKNLIKEEIENLRNQLNNQNEEETDILIENLKNQIANIEKESEERISSLLREKVEITQTEGSYVGLTLMDEFLTKTKLSDDLIKSEIQSKRQEDPIFRDIEKTVHFLMKQLETNREVLAPFQKILNAGSHIKKLRTDEHFHTFTIPTADRNFIDVKISNGDIEKLNHIFSLFPTLEIYFDKLKSFGINDQAIENKFVKSSKKIKKLQNSINKHYEINNTKKISYFNKEMISIKENIDEMRTSLLEKQNDIQNSLSEYFKDSNEDALNSIQGQIHNYELLQNDLNLFNAVIENLEIKFKECEKKFPKFSDNNIIFFQLDELRLSVFKLFNSSNNFIINAQNNCNILLEFQNKNKFIEDKEKLINSIILKLDDTLKNLINQNQTDFSHNNQLNIFSAELTNLEAEMDHLKEELALIEKNINALDLESIDQDTWKFFTNGYLSQHKIKFKSLLVKFNAINKAFIDLS